MDKARLFLLLSLLIPFAVSTIAFFSSSFAVFHRTDFQLSLKTASNNELKTLIFSTKEFNQVKWTVAEKEFEQDGKMYDVARIEKNGNAYLVYCKNDSLEDLLLNYFKTAGAKTKSKFILHGLFFEERTLLVCKEPHSILIRPFGYNHSFYRSIPEELTTPPPKKS